MSSHKGIPVVAAFLLQMPCFAAMLFSWLSTSHLIWVESSSFPSNMPSFYLFATGSILLVPIWLSL